MGRTDFWDWVDIEFERARRYGRPLALVLFDERDETIGARQPPAGLDERLRAIDHWCFVSGRLYVLVPETDSAGARTLVTRLQGELGTMFERAAIVSFPEHGVTRHALVKHLHARSAAVEATGQAEVRRVS